MILEAIVTTVDASGQLNIAPMGPVMQPGGDTFELRPFETSRTYNNLLTNPFGVLHVTDDVLLFASSAINKLEKAPATDPAEKGNGQILQNCCQWMEFEANQIPSDSPRKTFHCSIVAEGSKRRFFGFNRAKHAVLEATILATRIDFIPFEEIQTQFQRLETIVQKTGGECEIKAFEMLCEFVQK